MMIPSSSADQPANITNTYYFITSSYEQGCGFSMQFSFQYFCHFMDDLSPWNCTIDFKLILLDFAINSAIFTVWLQTYEWTDG